MVYVTGACGYIGSNICAELLKRKILFKGNDRNSSNINNEQMIENRQLSSLIADDLKGVHTVIHCASDISVGESMFNPAKYYKNNVLNTLHLMECIKISNVKHIIFSSTAAVYSTKHNKDGQFKEDDVLDPDSVYGRTKLACEYIIKDYCKQFQLKYTIFRYFNVSGSHHTGENHEPETHLIPCVFNSILQNTPINIYGSDYPTYDGTCVRDFIHIKDLVNAHIKAIEISHESNIINLGTGIGTSVKEIVNKCLDITKSEVRVDMLDRRIGDSPTLVCINEKAYEVLKWAPKESIDNILWSDWLYRSNI